MQVFYNCPCNKKKLNIIFPFPRNMEDCDGFQVMDDALFVLSHAIELNIELQQVIIQLSRKTLSNAAEIFKRIKPLWTYEKDIQNIFWDKYPLFSRISLKEQSFLLCQKDFQRFYSRVLQKVLFKLAFHSVNAKPLLFTTLNLLYLIRLAKVKRQSLQIQSFQSYLKIIKFILQENIAFQKLIIDLLFQLNMLTSIEMKQFQRLNDQENQQFLNLISPNIQTYCEQSKERIIARRAKRWKVPEYFMKPFYTGRDEHFIQYLEENIMNQTKKQMNQQQVYIYNKFIALQKIAEVQIQIKISSYQGKNKVGNTRKLAKKKQSVLSRERNRSLLMKTQNLKRFTLRQSNRSSQFKKSGNIINSKQDNIKKQKKSRQTINQQYPQDNLNRLSNKESNDSKPFIIVSSKQIQECLEAQIPLQSQTNSIILQAWKSFSATPRKQEMVSIEVQTSQHKQPLLKPIKKMKISNQEKENLIFNKRNQRLSNFLFKQSQSKVHKFLRRKSPAQILSQIEEGSSIMSKIIDLVNTTNNKKNFVNGVKASKLSQQYSFLQKEKNEPSINIVDSQNGKYQKTKSIRNPPLLEIKSIFPTTKTSSNFQINQIFSPKHLVSNKQNNSKTRSRTTISVNSKAYEIYDTRSKKTLMRRSIYEQ